MSATVSSTNYRALPLARPLAKLISRLRSSDRGQMLRATLVITALVVAVKACTLAKEMAVARWFGAADALDAFYVALVLPTYLMTVVGDTFNAAFIPTYIEVREKEGAQAAERLLSSIAAFDLAVLIGAAIVLALLHTWLLPLLGSSFGPKKLALTGSLFFMLLVWLSLGGLNSLWRAALNARGHFALTALVPALTPLVVLVLLVIAGSIWGVYALAIGTIVGVCAELALTGYALSIGGGAGLLPWWHGFDSSVRKVLGQYAPLVAGGVLMASTVLVDQAMAAMLGKGSVSALNYANKLVGIPLNLGIYSVSIVVFPTFSLLTAKEDWPGLRRALKFYSFLLAIITIPLTLALCFFSKPLVGLLFHGGAFTEQDVQLVGRVAALLCIQVPFYSIGVLYVRAISALKRNQILMWGTTISVVINVVLNYLFMKVLGLPGIALSTSAVYAISCFYLWLMLTRTLKHHESAAQSNYVATAANSVL
jgi:putative peptidoglycan lipid II flippase